MAKLFDDCRSVSTPLISASRNGCCRAAGALANVVGASLSNAAGTAPVQAAPGNIGLSSGCASDARLIVLEIFDEGHAVGFTHVGAEGMAAIAGSDQCRIDRAIVAQSGDIDDEAKFHRIVFTRAQGKRIRPLMRWA